MNEISAISLDRPARLASASDELTPAALAIGGIVAALALAGFLAVLATGHLDEDAYILFTYSGNLAAGHGIVWDWAHGHAEGATDFLWMIALAGLERLGMDVGAGAGLLNAAGLTMSYFAISRIARLRDAWQHGLLAAALLVSHLTAGALGGFSVDFYCGVFALACWLAVGQRYPALAFALLALGLVRPDGVILAAGILGATAIRDWQGVRRSGGYFLAAGVLAVGYFLWRWWYFGLLLPLPLMVKGHTLSVLLGLHWNVLPLIPLVGVLALIAWRWRDVQPRALLIAAGPILLFGALTFANQLQDLSFRFQAPMTLAVLALGFCAGRDRSRWLLLALIPSLAFGVRAIDREAQSLVQPDYVNYVFLHQVWTLDTSSLDARRNWMELSRARYLSLPVLDTPSSPYHTDPTHLGAMAARQFIATTSTPYALLHLRGEISRRVLAFLFPCSQPGA